MISEKEYKSRREILAKALKDDSLTLVASALPKVRSNDTHYPYRQNSNFYYLTGLKEDNAALVILKQNKQISFILFVQKKDPTLELWDGKSMGVKEAKKRFEVDEVYASDTLHKRIEKMLQGKSRVYYEFKEEHPFCKRLRSLSQTLYTHKNISKKIEKMRSIKSDAEIALIKKAISITKETHHKAMQLPKTGMYEYRLQAKFEYIFKKNGAYSDAYTTIVAGGDNANTLHYIKNDQKLKKGDLVLIDAGCEYDYYASDITRTIPVSGKFSKTQKKLYDLVLNVEEKIISMVKEGVLRSELQKKAQKMLLKGMLRLGILKGNYKKLWKKEIYKKYFPHGIGHFMGLDVHDQNPYKTKKQKEIPLKAGMVLTIEPGLYFPKDDTTIPKKFRGIAIRIEDNILVTKDGCVNLSEGIAKTTQEIERLYRG